MRSKVAVSVSSFGYEWITTKVPIEEVNDTITLNKALLAKSTSQKLWKYHADSVSTTLGQQGSTLEQLEREQTHTHRDRQTDYCACADS